MASDLTRAAAGLSYYRFHPAFLKLGCVKVAMLQEWLRLGFDVLFSDADVVWLGGHWAPWMDPSHA